jgi:hypothetical protein
MGRKVDQRRTREIGTRKFSCMSWNSLDRAKRTRRPPPPGSDRRNPQEWNGPVKAGALRAGLATTGRTSHYQATRSTKKVQRKRKNFPNAPGSRPRKVIRPVKSPIPPDAETNDDPKRLRSHPIPKFDQPKERLGQCLRQRPNQTDQEEESALAQIGS